MKKIASFLIVSVFLMTVDVYGQQDPEYTQYMYNMNVINPAYAGSKGTLSLNLLGRLQWVGIEGAPKTASLAIHSPVAERVGLGLSVIADEIGPLKQQNIFADFSYTINTSEKGKLAFGLKGGLTLHNLDILALTTINPSEPSLVDLQNRAQPNFGAGIYYYSNRFYAGLSLPNLLKTKHFEKGNGVYEASEKVHYFFTSGYVFELSENLKLKPSTMIRATPGSPISIDISGNMLLNEKVEFGLSYRLDDSISGLVNFVLVRNLRLGYAYDFTTSNLGDFNSGSHEVFLLWDIDLSRDKVISPRFF